MSRVKERGCARSVMGVVKGGAGQYIGAVGGVVQGSERCTGRKQREAGVQ